MINRNIKNYSIFGDKPGISPFDDDSCDFMKMKFIEICNTILYSSDARLVGKSYNILFRDYKQHIIKGSHIVAVSCFEEVIKKILIEEINDNRPSYGEMYTPFVRMLQLIRDQKEYNKIQSTVGYAYPHAYPCANYASRDLSKFILYTAIGCDENIKNSAMNTILKKHFTKK